MMDAAVRPQEPTYGHIWVNDEQDTTSDGTGPQIGHEGPMGPLEGLRAYVERHACMDEMTKAALRAYAREIEREVGNMQRALTIDAKPMTDENMAEHGWVRLPVDADGVPIHVGDMIAYEDNTKPKEVVALVPPSVVMVEDGPRYADMCRHHHAPTVEDVLREMLCAWEDTLTSEGVDGIIAEYAAKLRLAGDDA